MTQNIVIEASWWSLQVEIVHLTTDQTLPGLEWGIAAYMRSSSAQNL